MNDIIYFDSSATTRPYPEVLKTFDKVSFDDWGNPSSNHALGNHASTVLEKARKQIAKYLSVFPEEVIFTSGASEGNNLAIKGVAYHNKGWAKKIITTKAEHPSVLNVFRKMEEEGFTVIYLDYDKDGNLDLDQLKRNLDDRTSLVSIMAVNNEVGYVFNIKEAYEITKTHSKAVFHVDATQAITKMEVDPEYYDLMTFSGHKIGGLKGSGVLVKKKDIMLDEQIIGGSQEENLRAGTSAVGLDASLATAIRISFSSMEERRKKAKELNDYLRKRLSEIDEVKIITPENNSTPFILNFALMEHKGSVVSEALSNAGIYVSTKSACSSKEAGYSYVIKDAGYSLIEASNSIRLSFSGTETLDQADIFIQKLKEILSQLKIKEI